MTTLLDSLRRVVGNYPKLKGRAAHMLDTALQAAGSMHGVSQSSIEQSLAEAIIDDDSVYVFAHAMRMKMSEARQKGRSGWYDKERCDGAFLSELLRGQLEKGDPLDVGIYSMMLHQRGDRIDLGPAWTNPDQPRDCPDLQGLREALLTQREIVRNEDGFLEHPAYPYLDESVRPDQFLNAFGIECLSVFMDGNHPDAAEVSRYFDDGECDCSFWTPSAPTHEWILIMIYDTENGPAAMFIRRALGGRQS